MAKRPEVMSAARWLKVLGERKVEDQTMTSVSETNCSRWTKILFRDTLHITQNTLCKRSRATRDKILLAQCALGAVCCSQHPSLTWESLLLESEFFKTKS